MDKNSTVCSLEKNIPLFTDFHILKKKFTQIKLLKNNKVSRIQLLIFCVCIFANMLIFLEIFFKQVLDILPRKTEQSIDGK